MQNTGHSASPAKAWIITGPASGIGRRTALELARHGTVVLVGRDLGKLSEVETEIRAQRAGPAVSVASDPRRRPPVGLPARPGTQSAGARPGASLPLRTGAAGLTGSLPPPARAAATAQPACRPAALIHSPTCIHV